MLDGRSSWIHGQFRANDEYGGGPYTAGMNGWVPMVQWLLAF